MRFLVIILLVTFSNTFAQIDYSVSGRVVDENNIPLQGANIYFPELQKGTISDSAGTFTLTDLPAGLFSLRVSYISYETVILVIDADHYDSPLVIRMKPSPIQGKAVVISGGKHSSQHENAIKIEAINSRDLTLTGTPSFIGSITQIPGVSNISKGGGVATPVIRGLSTSNILFLHNGIRLENYQFSENHPYLADEFGVGQVEVIKGPASLLYGSDAIGGVINSIPESPANVGNIAGDAGLQYFTNTKGMAGTVGVKASSEKLSWGLRGSLKSHEDYLDGENNFIPNTRFNGNSLKAFASYNVRKAIYRINYEFQGLKAGLCNEESVNLVAENSRKNKVWYQDLNNHLIISKNTFFLTHYKLMINVSYQLNNRKLIGPEPDSGPLLVNMNLQTFNLDIRNIFSRSEKSEYTIAIQGMSQVNRNYEAINRILPDYRMSDFALFGMAQYNLKNHIHMQLGLRFDNRILFAPEQEKSGHSHEEEHEEGHDEELMEKLDRYYGNISGSFGFTWELTDDLLLRSNLASAYRSPNIAELTQDGEHGVRYEQGDRNLEPQRNYELDVSIHYHKIKVLLDASVFYNSISDYIFLDYTSDTTDEGLLIFRYKQDNAEIYGGELMIEMLPIKSFNIKATYSYLRGKQGNGEDLPFIPQNNLKTEIEWRNSVSGFLSEYYIRLGAEYAFKQEHPSNFETPSSEYLILNAGVGCTFTVGKQTIELDCIATNLFNQLYIDHLSTLKELNYFNKGRDVMLSIRMPFAIGLN